MNIWVAASDNQIEKVKEYIAKGQTPNDRDPNGYTCMHAAASYGHRDLLEYLISVGGDVNITDEEGDTPLHVVEDVETAKFLLEKHNADFRRKNEEGQTALEKLDEEDEFTEVVEYLKSKLSGAEVEAFEKNRGVEQGGEDDDELPQDFDQSQMRFTMEHVDQVEDEEGRRKQIEEILNSENPEEGLRKLVEQAVHAQMDVDGDDEVGPSKKIKR